MATTADRISLATMGGAYGNLAALAACLDDAAARGAGRLAFLGDAIGCCGHSEEVVAAVRERFELLVAGNHEQQAFARAESCGCGYSSADDEATSCEAFRLATAMLTDASADWLGTWPERAVVELAGGPVLLCHGSPGHTSEFLYEVELDDLRLEAWLDRFDVRGFVCTHSGLPWVRHLRGGRFAVNCGAVGKPDHDGDPAVHYALLRLEAPDRPAEIEIRRVPYDHQTWAGRMEAVGIAPVFVEPIRTGVWTTGVASLPPGERYRWLRAAAPAAPALLPAPPRAGGGAANGAAAPVTAPASWRPERLDRTAFGQVLESFQALGLLAPAERDEVLALFDPAFPYFAQLRLADSLHVHIKVDDVAALPAEAISALGTTAENARAGYVKYPFPGGVNLIFSSVETAEEDRLPPAEAASRPRPCVDHVGIDLRRDVGLVRAAFDDAPSLARRAGWWHKPQGGPARPVYCCHAQVSEKHWVYPPREGSRFSFPVELAYGPLVISAEMLGCDLRPIDPRHPAAGLLAAACAPEA
jgi:diadenosine tetraphosphatase ApaH/serine/threonine PP2A family protein phosphatase